MRTTRLVAVAVIAAATAIALAGCVRVLPTGPLRSEDRAIDAVTTVVLETSGDLVISEGAPRLVVHASQRALDRLTSEVGDGTLVLGTAPGPDLGLGRVRYELTVPELAAIEIDGSGDVDSTVSSAGTVRVDLSGSGDVDWAGLDADRADVRVSGSGDVTLRGASTGLSIELDGSGDVDADGLRTDVADVAVDGSGDVDVAARDRLVAEVSGSGGISYSGDPELVRDVSGPGEIERD